MTSMNATSRSIPQQVRAEVIREFTPIAGKEVHGVTFDGKHVWYARTGALVEFDPEEGKIVRELAIPADAGTTFDGRHLFQIADDRILVVDPADGRVLRSLPTPCGDRATGMAYADGYLFIGEYREGKIHKVDAKTGEVERTLSSNRWVTGVSCVGGELWHGSVDANGGAELRKLASDGTVEEVVKVEGVDFISGVERTNEGTFWCGGESGKLRLIGNLSQHP